MLRDLALNREYVNALAVVAKRRRESRAVAASSTVSSRAPVK
jgi:hypothetical protein